MADAVNLDRPFKVTCDRCGSECELDKHANPPEAECPKCGTLDRNGFTVTCPNCGSSTPELDNDVQTGGSCWTGWYGYYEIRCGCGNEQTVF